MRESVSNTVRNTAVSDVPVSDGLPWQPFPPADFAGLDIWICLLLVFYAWVVQRNFREIEVIFRHLFDFREPGRHIGFAVSGRAARFRNRVFFLLSSLALSGLVYRVLTCNPFSFSGDFFLCLPVFGENDPALLLRCLGFALVFYAVKWVVLRLVSNIFAERRFGFFVWRTGLYVDLAFSLIALPLLAFSLYMGKYRPDTIISSLCVVLAIVFIVKMLKVVFVGKKYSRFSYLHIFAYFCALETLPFVSLWQVFFCVDIL